jgi:hypothetical protein
MKTLVIEDQARLGDVLRRSLSELRHSKIEAPGRPRFNNVRGIGYLFS